MMTLYKLVTGFFSRFFRPFLQYFENTKSEERIDEDVEAFIREIEPQVQDILREDVLLQLKALTQQLVSGVSDYSGIIIKLVSLLEDIIKKAEERGIIDGLTGPDKKEYCTKIILRLYEDHEVDLEWIPRFLEPIVVTKVVETLVDIIVDILNRNQIFEHRSGRALAT